MGSFIMVNSLSGLLKGFLEGVLQGSCFNGFFTGSFTGSFTLRLKIAQQPYIVWSLGPKAFKYESLEPKGYGSLTDSLEGFSKRILQGLLRY